MEVTTAEVTLRKIEASEGMYLTQNYDVDERTYAKVVYLATNELVENWREATEEEKFAYEEQRQTLAEAEIQRIKEEL